VRRAGFLLALHDQLDGDRRRLGTAYGQAGPDAQRVEEHLALVVGGAPREQAAVALGRFERRALPLLQRLGRLDVVVPVKQDARRIGVIGGPLGEQGGQPVRAGFPDLGDWEAPGAQMPGEPFGAAPHVCSVSRIGRDRRDGQPLLQVIDELAGVGVYVGTGIHA